MSAASTSGGRHAGPPPAVRQEVAIEGLFPTVLVTLVESVSDGLVAVSPPRIGGVEMPLAVNREFLLTYRVHGVRCEVTCVVARGPSAGETAYALRMLGAPRRNQRRDDVRVPATLEAILRRESRDDEDPPPVTGTTVDLSLGGVLCVCETEFRVGETASIVVNCGDPGTVSARIEILRCSRDHDAHAWRVAARFAEMAPDDRRRLSAYLLDRQRLLRRRQAGLE